MSPDAYVRALIKKLESQGIEYRETESTSVSLFFWVPSAKKGFTVPRPLTDFGWTFAQQEMIANTLDYLGLEFWPLDYNLWVGL